MEKVGFTQWILAISLLTIIPITLYWFLGDHGYMILGFFVVGFITRGFFDKIFGELYRS